MTSAARRAALASLRTEPTARCYAAVAALMALFVAAGVGLRAIGSANALFLLLAGVLLAAWGFGRGPGLFAAALAAAAAGAIWYDPLVGIRPGKGDLVSLLLFAVVAPSAGYLTSAVRRSLGESHAAGLEAEGARELAENALTQLRRVASITDVALSQLQLRELLQELLHRLYTNLQADTASVFLVSESGGTLHEFSSAGLRARLNEHPSIPVGRGLAGRAAAERQPIAVPDLRTVEVMSPLLRDRMASAMAAPLVNGEQLVGVLTVATSERRDFSRDELAVLSLVADRMARAITQGQLVERIQQINQELFEAVEERDDALVRYEAAQRQLTTLVEASGSLIETLEVDGVLPRIVRLASSVLGAGAYAVWSVTEAGDAWEMRVSEGLSGEYVRTRSRIDITPGTPRMPGPVIVADVEADPQLAGRLEGYRAEGIRAVLSLPIRSAGATVGALTFYYRQPHEPTELDLRVAAGLANLSASAIHIAELSGQERQARAEAEALGERLAFLASASGLLHESLDYEKTLNQVARLAVPRLADWCAVTVLAEDGSGNTLALAHVDDDQVRFVRELEAEYPPDLDAELGWPHVVRTRQPQLVTSLPADMLDDSPRNRERLRIIRELGLRSALVVPLIAHDRVLGAISLVTASLHPPLTREDIPFAEELARRAAIAIDNARLCSRLESLLAELQEANAIKDEFLGLVSHELRTPITSIYGNARILLQYRDLLSAEDQHAALADIERESDRLRRIIENLLILARFDRTHVLETEPVRVERLVESIVRRFEESHPGRQVLMSFPPGTPPADAQPTYLELVLINLLTNADKYSPADLPVEVSVTRGEDDDELHVRVLDRGVGVMPAELTELFSPFYRSNRARQIASGMGIGLAVCKRILDAQGSRIWALPRPDGGTEFGFSLRVAPGGEG